MTSPSPDMSLPGDSPGDDALLSQFREALRAVDPGIDRVVEAGRAAWTWRTIDAELAALTRDSWRAADGFALARDDGGRRTLVFEGTTGSVEIQITGGRIVGQLLPPTSGRVQLLVVDGPGTSVDADEVGCFSLDVPAGALWRLRCTRDSDAIVTTWIDP